MSNFADIINQVLTTTLANVNISLVIILLAAGYVCKHVFTKLDNNLIPVILGLISVVFLVFLNLPFNPQEQLISILVEAIATTLIATIAHDQAKKIITDLKNTVNKEG